MRRVLVRACSRTREGEESRTTTRSTGAPSSPRRRGHGARINPPRTGAFCLVPPLPPASGRFSPNSLCCHTRPSRPPSSRPLSLTVALNPKCSRRSLLGAIFLFRVVARLGQCCCCCCRRCRSYRCRRLPRPRGLHYGVLQASLEGRCGAWVSLCMDQKGRGIIVLPTAQRGRTSHLGVAGGGSSVLELGDYSFSWGKGALWGMWGQARQKGLWLPPPLGHDRRWRPMGLLPARPPIRALFGENLILTPLWREKQACLVCLAE